MHIHGRVKLRSGAEAGVGFGVDRGWPDVHPRGRLENPGGCREPRRGRRCRRKWALKRREHAASRPWFWGYRRRRRRASRPSIALALRGTPPASPPKFPSMPIEAPLLEGMADGGRRRLGDWPRWAFPACRHRHPFDVEAGGHEHAPEQRIELGVDGRHSLHLSVRPHVPHDKLPDGDADAACLGIGGELSRDSRASRSRSVPFSLVSRLASTSSMVSSERSTASGPLPARADRAHPHNRELDLHAKDREAPRSPWDRAGDVIP